MLYKIFIILLISRMILGKTLATNGLFSTERMKIVGGSEADAGEIPWQVSLKISDSSLSCGGSIVGSEWVLTAAHCSTFDVSRYEIRAGSLRYDSGGSVHEVQEIVLYPEYNYTYNRYFNDIALMRVSPAFKFDSNTNAVQLVTYGVSIGDGVVATVSGWGATRYEGLFSEVLLKVDVPIVSKKVCDEQYAAIGGLHDYQICAGLPQGGVDACLGDDGGPLFRKGIIYGIVSNGNGCAWPGYPGIYTEVSIYRNWIDSIIGIY